MALAPSPDHHFLVVQILLLFAVLQGVGSINMLGLEVPAQMILGQSAKLKCNYDLEGSELYSLKWYKNGNEFYRYMPRDIRKTTVFSQKGVSIDLQYSDAHQVYIPSVGLETGGIYRCEVSTEAPDFDTISRSVQVKVAALPQGPFLTGLSSTYNPGDLVSANCTARKSQPVTHLVWYINGSPVQPDDKNKVFLPLARTTLLVDTDSQGFISSTLNLEIKLRRTHFEDGRVKLKCTAMLEDFFIRSNEKSLEMMRSQGQRVRGVISRRDDKDNVREVISEEEERKELFSDGDTSRTFENVPYISSRQDQLQANLFILSALLVLYWQILTIINIHPFYC